MEGRSYLAFAVGYRRVGAIYMDGEEVLFWKMSSKAYHDLGYAADFVSQLIEEFVPNVVITEQLLHAQRKGKHTKLVIAALGKAAEKSSIESMAVPRHNPYKNKYEESKALIQKHPNMAPLRPKVRRYFENEPRNTVLFEALSFAESVKRGPTEQSGAPMG